MGSNWRLVKGRAGISPKMGSGLLGGEEERREKEWEFFSPNISFCSHFDHKIGSNISKMPSISPNFPVFAHFS